MNWLSWAINNWEWLLTAILIIVIGIPFLVVMIIPALIYLGSKGKKIPSLDFLIKYFGVDVSQPPYSDWMNKHPMIFVGLTAIELYVSWYLIKLLRGVKWVLKEFFTWVYKGVRALVTLQFEQYKKWDKEFDEEEKKRKKEGE